VASCPISLDARGYATPSALVLCVAIATMATTMVGRSLTHLELAHADLKRLRAEYEMEGAHLAAAAGVVRSEAHGPYQWTFGSDDGWVEVLAEPDAAKIPPTLAAKLRDSDFALFGVSDVQGLRGRLSAVTGKMPAVDTLDAAVAWRTCARSVVAYHGEADHFTYTPPKTPGPGPDPQTWHIGEVWRIRVTTQAGWRDDRTVRFTGDAQHPVAIVDRRLSRFTGEPQPCPALLAALSAP
jgi:hypothetical protein